MISLRKAQPDLITIIATPVTIACAWIQRTANPTRYALKAYKRFTAQDIILPNGTLGNSTLFAQELTSFIRKHQLQKAYISLALQKPSLYEAIITTPLINPDVTTLLAHQKQTIVWDTRYLYHDDKGTIRIYVCGLPHPLRLQYILFSLRFGINLARITSISMAHLHVYTAIHAPAFRHAQLGQDLHRCNDDIASLIDYEIVARMLTVPTRYAAAVHQELAIITPLLGLFISEQEIAI